ncbi:aldehyde dehydrogenase family protein [Streptomyces griseoloalbus]|uniref:aldehyde dehydrogenase family protein n=1 Tax=Streptomyces griseoloalbus TaxID=67303 RepID=UPI0033B3C947
MSHGHDQPHLVGSEDPPPPHSRAGHSPNPLDPNRCIGDQPFLPARARTRSSFRDPLGLVLAGSSDSWAEWRKPSSVESVTSTSASTGHTLGQVPVSTHADADEAVAAACRSFADPAGWSWWQPAERAGALRRLALSARTAWLTATATP